MYKLSNKLQDRSFLQKIQVESYKQKISKLKYMQQAPPLVNYYLNLTKKKKKTCRSLHKSANKTCSFYTNLVNLFLPICIFCIELQKERYGKNDQFISFIKLKYLKHEIFTYKVR